SAIEKAPAGNVVLRAASDQLTARAQVKVSQPSAIGRLIFVTQTEVQGQPVVHPPVILYKPEDLLRESVLCHASEVSQATQAASGRSGQSKQEIGRRITGIVSTEIDDAVLAAALIVADQQVSEIATDLECLVAVHPGDRLASAVVDVVLHDARAIADEAAARPGESWRITGEIDVRQRVIAGLRRQVLQAQLSGIIGRESVTVAGPRKVGFEKAQARVADQIGTEDVRIAYRQVLGVIRTDHPKPKDISHVRQVVVRIGIPPE